jgi:hypothetical protein
MTPAMQTIEYRTIDKSGWGDGPWKDEPDKKQWEHKPTRLPCLIVRGPAGALCGYVGVPKRHPAYGIDYDHVDVDVHGGLTFAGPCQSGAEEHGICHKVEPGESDDIWWLGFDCNHAGDWAPMMYAHASSDYLKHCGPGAPTGWGRVVEYRDFTYVENEVSRLAEQLASKTV